MPQAENTSPPHLFLFHGSESYLAHQKILLWRQKFAEKYNGDLNISLLDGDEVKAGDILQASESMPFLSEKRLVIVKNFCQKASAKEQSDLAQNLDRVPDFCVLVFLESDTVDKRTSLYKKLLKIGQVEEGQPLEGYQLSNWIQQESKKIGAILNSSTAYYLANHAGHNLWKLHQEISKLSLYAKSRPVTTEDIDFLVTPEISTSIFKLTDYLGQKRPADSLKTLHQLIDSGEDIFMIFHMIVRQFRIIIQVKDLLTQKQDAKQITATLKQHPFVIQNTIRQSQNFTLNQLKTIYAALLELEIGFKTGKIKSSGQDVREFILALDRFVVESTKEKVSKLSN